MPQQRQLRFWAASFVILALSLWLLSEILLPFVAGMAIAYFFDPVCDRLERWGLGRTTATAVLTGLFMISLLLVIGLLVPVAIEQANELLKSIPALVDLFRKRVIDIMAALTLEHPQMLERLRETVSGQVGTVISWFTGLADNVLSGGIALLNILSLLFVTPVVAFFLLRDWDTMVAKLDEWLPRQHAPTIRRLARNADEILAAYVRGTATVCLILGTFYALSLSLIGLKGGLFVGLLAGMLSFIPFLGAVGGLVLAVSLAIAQFDSIWMVGATAVIFFLGQAVEGNVLTPKLVGERVGLHPVIVIFALLSGGAILGFTGVLIALPIAAVGGVLVRFALEKYLQSPLYSAEAPNEDNTEGLVLPQERPAQPD